ncbi:MAG: IS200/IS605 family transposase [Acidobacteria bacterium]|nr:IS200/IS605 family transposase [Acidobacteriota bacterium]
MQPWEHSHQIKPAHEGGRQPPEKAMPQSYVNLIYHIVFSTKDRRPIITDAYRDRLHEYIGGVIRGQGSIALAINGMEDHVHVLAKLRQDKALSDVIRNLKASASGWIHDVFPKQQDFAWQNGYGAFTVSGSQIDVVRKYIADQAFHHQKRSFQDEFIALLRTNEIEFDERYLWK